MKFLIGEVWEDGRGTRFKIISISSGHDDIFPVEGQSLCVQKFRSYWTADGKYSTASAPQSVVFDLVKKVEEAILMEIEAGKFYKSRIGDKVEIYKTGVSCRRLSKTDSVHGAFITGIDAGRPSTWSATGRYASPIDEHYYDIICEWSDQPTLQEMMKQLESTKIELKFDNWTCSADFGSSARTICVTSGLYVNSVWIGDVKGTLNGVELQKALEKK